jgi:uridine kinase
MHTLILMRGLPGSGKTTAARELTKHLNPKDYRLFAADDYFMNTGKFVFDSAQAGQAYAVRGSLHAIL